MSDGVMLELRLGLEAVVGLFLHRSDDLMALRVLRRALKRVAVTVWLWLNLGEIKV
jgi:hypothetical protein